MFSEVLGRVLVVDDDASFRSALREHLETEGYSVVEAANGLAALGRLRGGLRPSVIVFDLMMPVMDGWDFRDGQLSDPDLRDIPVVLVTAAGFSRSSLRTQFGAIVVVAKPFLPSEILAAIKMVHGARRR
jgi:CheY-like chemotaxis protein